MDTAYSHWVEWKEKCDLRICNPETQGALLQYMQKRACSLVEEACAYTHRAPTGISEMDGWRWWNLFEGFYIARASRTQKHIKDWLFYTTEHAYNSPVEALERKVCFCLKRDVLRGFVRDCCPRIREEVSMDEPVGRDDPDGDTRKDVLSLHGDETRDTIARNEAERIAADYANSLFAGMNRRERVAVAATYLNLAHSNVEVEYAAGCKKSVLRTAYRALFVKLVERMKSDYPDESPENLVRMGFYVFEALKVKAYEWARHESICHGLISISDRRTNVEAGI